MFIGAAPTLCKGFKSFVEVEVDVDVEVDVGEQVAVLVAICIFEASSAGRW